MNIPDELLAAYVDGELEGAERLRVEQAIAHDARLAQRVAQHRALRERLRGAFDATLRESMPQRLLQAARLAAPTGSAQVIDLARVRAARTRRGERHRSTISRRVAIAASLLVGLFAGLFVARLSSSGALTDYRDGVVLARGALAQALDQQLASNPGSSAIRIGLTFRAKSGEYCRTFIVTGGSSLAGLACRAQERWQVPALIDVKGTASDPQHFRMAASTLPPALAQLVDARISGAPLDAPRELKARDQDWH
jgi:hypothetical protein